MIVGGGVGGLVAAIGMQRAGHNVTVVEQRARYDESNSGGGISLAYNGQRCLSYLGLRGRVSDIADMATHHMLSRHADGVVIMDRDLEHKLDSVAC